MHFVSLQKKRHLLTSTVKLILHCYYIIYTSKVHSISLNLFLDIEGDLILCCIVFLALVIASRKVVLVTPAQRKYALANYVMHLTVALFL